jgi:hypothetical protein
VRKFWIRQLSYHVSELGGITIIGFGTGLGIRSSPVTLTAHPDDHMLAPTRMMDTCSGSAAGDGIYLRVVKEAPLCSAAKRMPC